MGEAGGRLVHDWRAALALVGHEVARGDAHLGLASLKACQKGRLPATACAQPV